VGSGDGSEEGKFSTRGAVGCEFLFLEFLRRYHQTPTIAIARTMIPDTVPPIIGPRVVLERD